MVLAACDTHIRTFVQLPICCNDLTRTYDVEFSANAASMIDNISSHCEKIRLFSPISPRVELPTEEKALYILLMEGPTTKESLSCVECHCMLFSDT
jgi:hypothetical protein